MSGKPCHFLSSKLKFFPKTCLKAMHLSLTDAAKRYAELPHQMAAWNLVERHIPLTVLAEFRELYAVATEYPACPPEMPSER